MKLNRKLTLALSLVLFSTLAGCSSIKMDTTKVSAAQIKPGKNLTFFVATDIHYLSKDLTDGKKAFQQYLVGGVNSVARNIDYSDELVNALIYDIEKKKPDILIISGDLTNNGEKKSHLDLAKRLKKIEDLGTSVYVIPGNHDISNPWARGFREDKEYITDSISEKDFSNIYNDFGYKEAISRDKASLSYLASPSEDVWLLMLDTSQYNNNYKEPQLEGRISAETYKWIKKCTDMAKEKGAQIITVMHHNLIDHNSVMNTGYTINNNKEALNKFQEFGLNLALSGHIHIQDISSYKKDGNTIYDIATNALSVYPNQYGVLKYSPDSGFDYSTSIADVEGWSKQANIKDDNLNNFRQYSKKFFEDRVYSRAYFNAEAAGGYNDNELDLIAKTLVQLNDNFFAGTENASSEAIMKSPGYKLWMTAGENSRKTYVLSVVKDYDDTDDNNLHIARASK